MFPDQEVDTDETPAPETLPENVFDNDDKEPESLKSDEEIAREVLEGKWGPNEGNARRQALSAAGYDPNRIKKAIVRLLNSDG